MHRWFGADPELFPLNLRRCVTCSTCVSDEWLRDASERELRALSQRCRVVDTSNTDREEHDNVQPRDS